MASVCMDLTKHNSSTILAVCGMSSLTQAPDWPCWANLNSDGTTGKLVWGIPKGHLEAGESSEQAAVREVREETGIEADVEQPLGDVTYWFARRDDDGRPVRIFKRVRFFLMRARRGRFADRDAEMDAVRWFSPEDAARITAYENERALVRRAMELLRG